MDPATFTPKNVTDLTNFTLSTATNSYDISCYGLLVTTPDSNGYYYAFTTGFRAIMDTSFFFKSFAVGDTF